MTSKPQETMQLSAENVELITGYLSGVADTVVAVASLHRAIVMLSATLNDSDIDCRIDGQDWLRLTADEIFLLESESGKIDEASFQLGFSAGKLCALESIQEFLEEYKTNLENLKAQLEANLK